MDGLEAWAILFFTTWSDKLLHQLVVASHTNHFNLQNLYQQNRKLFSFFPDYQWLPTTPIIQPSNVYQQKGNSWIFDGAFKVDIILSQGTQRFIGWISYKSIFYIAQITGRNIAKLSRDEIYQTEIQANIFGPARSKCGSLACARARGAGSPRTAQPLLTALLGRYRTRTMRAME